MSERCVLFNGEEEDILSGNHPHLIITRICIGSIALEVDKDKTCFLAPHSKEEMDLAKPILLLPASKVV
jgi:hypothetical protein